MLDAHGRVLNVCDGADYDRIGELHFLVEVKRVREPVRGEVAERLKAAVC